MDQHHAKTESEPDQDPPDKDLIDRVREGDLEAFDPLYRRHRGSAMRHARYWTRSEAAAEDLSAESFTRVLYAIRNGNGPTETFRPYLLATMRHVASDWAQSDRRLLLVPDLVELAGPQDEQDPVIAALERSLAGQAFMSLPERWQLVLWHTEVEQEGPTVVAPLLGIEPGAVAALSYRAREGLRQAYLQAHITELGAESCRPFAEKLGTHTRGRLGRREAAKVNRHVHGCTECAGLFAMLKYINGNINIGGVVAPAVFGTAVATKVVTVAVLGTTGVTHAVLVVRILAKARYASPRQQAVAVTTTAAVAGAAIAFALAGSPQPPPAASPRPKPTPVATPAVRPTPSPQAPPPSAPPPRPTPKPRPSSRPTVPKPVEIAPTTPAATPSPEATTPSPTPPPPTPDPSPSPTHVMCPGVASDWLPPSIPSWIEDIVVDPRDELDDPMCAPGWPPTLGW